MGRSAHCVFYPLSEHAHPSDRRHRSQDAHDCSAPRSYNVLGDAALQRKEKAREVLMKHFPDQPIREIEKPIAHNRDPKRLGQGVLEESPPSAVTTSTPNLDEVKPKTKTKEDKVWEIHVKKVKMSAKPLIPSQKDDGDRRFFELKSGVVDPAEVIKWKDVGKMSGVLEKVWVNGVRSSFLPSRALTSVHTRWKDSRRSAGEK